MKNKFVRKLLRSYTRQCYYEAITNRSEGEISIGEARFLGSLISNLKTSGPIVEIGTHLGFSTLAMCLFKQDARPLITVDNFCWNALGLKPDMQFRAVSTILSEVVDNSNVKIVRQEKAEFYNSYHGETPSLIFLDADHRYQPTAEDIRWAKSTGAEVVCGHDYCDLWPGVIQAVEEAGGCKNIVETLWVL